MHGLFYSSDADATRAFLRDALKLPFTDVGGGWLIFDLPEADLGVHPVGEDGKPGANKHDVSFYCDDIEGTVADLRSRGVEFAQDPEDHGYGFVTYFTMPGGLRVQLYEAKYQKATKTAKAVEKQAAKAAKAKKKAAKAEKKVAKAEKKVAKAEKKAAKAEKKAAKKAPAEAKKEKVKAKAKPEKPAAKKKR